MTRSSTALLWNSGTDFLPLGSSGRQLQPMSCTALLSEASQYWLDQTHGSSLVSNIGGVHLLPHIACMHNYSVCVCVCVCCVCQCVCVCVCTYSLEEGLVGAIGWVLRREN